MKKYQLFPLLSLVGGVCGAALRFLQNRSGFEPDTGLPIPGDPYAFLLPGVLLLVAALTLLLCLRLPRESESELFADAFSARSTFAATAAVAGIFLWCLSGAAGVLMNRSAQYTATADGLYYPVSTTVQRADFLLAGALVIAALCIFPAAAVRRFRNLSSMGNLLLIPVVYLVLQLTLSFREISINASQQAYYVELLAMVFLTLSLFRLSSFAFHDGKDRHFALYSVMATVLCITALADVSTLQDRLFYAGGACLTIGFLLLRLTTAGEKENAKM